MIDTILTLFVRQEWAEKIERTKKRSQLFEGLERTRLDERNACSDNPITSASNSKGWNNTPGPLNTSADEDGTSLDVVVVGTILASKLMASSS